ncbi:hypothetical protein ABZ479_37720 [Streptomyces sp. NPDC005722]
MHLIDGGATAPDAPVLRTGGVPLVPEGFPWPLCRTCGGALQFLAHLPSGDGAVAVFLCQNDPGMCEDWDPAAVTALRPVPAGGGAPERALGRLGGEPGWIQGDETPHCPSCTATMTFTAQLEEGTDHTTSANFGGGGRGYVFTCRPCGEAAFLWQC